MNNESVTTLIEVWFTKKKKKEKKKKNKIQKSPWVGRWNYQCYLTANLYVFYKVANLSESVRPHFFEG